MPYLSRIFRLFCLFAFLSTSVLFGQERTSQELPYDSAINAEWIKAPSNLGFTPVKITITNKGNTERTWIFSQKSSSIGSLRAPAKQTASTIIFIPRSLGEAYHLTATDQVSRKSERVYLQHRAYGKFFALWAQSHNDITNSISSSSININILNPSQWPADWRVYSSQTCFFIQQSDFDQLDTPRKQAIRQWVSTGGTLITVELDENQKKLDESPATSHGWGTIRHITAPNAKSLAAHISSIKQPDDSLGQYPKLPDQSSKYLVSSPSAIIIALLVAFAIIVGPLTLFLWAPKTKRQRLFFLVPGISAGFSILLLLSILLVDGTGGEGLRATSVFLDPQSGTATVKQHQVCLTGMLLDTSFKLNHKAEIHVSFKNDLDSPSLYRNGDTASGNWFVSRASIDHKLMEIKQTRSRISIIGNEKGAPIVQSTLPVGLKRFIYQDQQGNFWEAESLPPGQKTTLQRSPHGSVDFKGNKDSFNARGTNSDIAPINTLDTIKWEDEPVFYFGPVSHE